MKLPKFLSPSSLKVFENQLNTFYLERIVGERTKDPQSMAAAVGSSFDAHIKGHIAKKLGIEAVIAQRLLSDWYVTQETKDWWATGNYSLTELLLKSSVEPQNTAEATQSGKVLFDSYKNLPPPDFVDLEIHRFFNLLHGCNVPLYMKLDATCSIAQVSNTAVVVPFDWKVSGYTSSASPKKGYKCLYDCGINKGCHDDYSPSLAMDQVDRDWATQLCTYGWGLGIAPLTPFRSLVDMIVIRPNGFRIARYDAWITEEFQKELVQRYTVAWNDIRTGKFLERLPSERLFQEMAASKEGWY